MLGSARVPRKLRRGDMTTGRTAAAAVCRMSVRLPRRTVLPSTARSSACRLGATTSTSFCCNASWAVNERLSTTAAWASGTLRPFRAARARMLAAASASTFLPRFPGMSSPSPPTGWAAPVLVSGAMAATSAAIRM